MADVDGTISALQGGLTSLSPSAAVSNIDSWQEQLAGSSDPTLSSISDDLGELKSMLQSGNLNGSSIGALLTRLGDNTTSAASSAPSNVQAKLQTLGSLLSKAGGSLS